MSKPTQKTSRRERDNNTNSWQTFPLIILVPSTLIVSFGILIQFFPEPSSFRFAFFRSANMSAKKEGRLSPSDPNSYARPDIAKVVNISLHLDVNFEKEILDGFAVLTVKKVDPTATEVILDSRYLVIDSVADESNGKELDFNVAQEGYVGSKVVVQLPKSEAEEVKIKIVYRTTAQCTALQWLDKNQTASKTHPYMFSQCQAIHCRSMVPCQDTPSVKSPYTAEITAPADLTVLMSAVRQGEPSEGSSGKKVYKFHQKIPIQSYLIAIAVGKVESRKIGPRSHVWSEKEFVDKAAFDFSETETMLQKAEELCGPYVWGTYDILVLPPSFPYGGMENPCLTFATPTLLSGDKSLAGVIAHEIAHSWSGNLVTNKNFEHFWLNEGFTVFTERKIQGRMFGDAARHFNGIGGWTSLKYGIEVLGESNPLTALVVDLEDVDPDDAFSVVPYEKGAAFLWYLEELVGGPAVFEPFLKKYYDHFKYQSIDSNDFKKFFLDNFKDNANISKIDWNTWFKAPGLPKHKPDYDQSLAQVCADLRKRWVSWDEKNESDFETSDIKNFSAGQVMEFLVQLTDEEPLSVTKMAKLEEVYHFNNNNNSEIKFRWIRLGLKAKWEKIIPKAVEMVTEQGRMKFLRPIYRDMYAWDKTKELAVSTFIKNKPTMMHVAIHGLENDLHLKETS